MKLSDILREIGELSCRSVAIQSDIKGWVNRVQRQIAQRRNWASMHSRLTITVPSGDTSVALPSNFKELSAEKSPVTVSRPGSVFPIPVNVRSREEIERMQKGVVSFQANVSGFASPYFVFIECNDDEWTLNLPEGLPVPSDADYTVSCYLYPEDLEAGDDENWLTKDGELVEALLHKVKAIAYQAEDPTDARGAASLSLYEQAMATAAIEDARRKIAGRPVRM